MRSMEQLGGSGGMPSKKFLKNKCSEIDSGEFCDQNYHCYRLYVASMQYSKMLEVIATYVIIISLAM